MNFIKYLKYIPICLIYYIIIFFLIYIISGFLLIYNITPSNKLINTYQVNYYLNSGMRNIWQSNPDCVEYDKDLIFIPRHGECEFNNVEFKTKISFNEYGRFSYHPNKNKKGIAVLGDSFAMGWGVNDDETFSAILEKQINQSVYNLAVSGYGTRRELIRLSKSNLLSKIDTIILQYCYNDYGENFSLEKNSSEDSNNKFNIITSGKEISFWTKLRKSIRYSVTIPIDLITKKNAIIDFKDHRTILVDLIKKYPEISNKRIIIFYVNGPNIKFSNFSNLNDQSKNFTFVDISLNKEHYFKIDNHLNLSGHKHIAKELKKILR
mgnify:CR=1 FL=1